LTYSFQVKPGAKGERGMPILVKVKYQDGIAVVAEGVTTEFDQRTQSLVVRNKEGKTIAEFDRSLVEHHWSGSLEKKEESF
jgi:hypothetical protein